MPFLMLVILLLILMFSNRILSFNNNIRKLFSRSFSLFAELNEKNTFKNLPRLYINQKLNNNNNITLDSESSHYIINVLRKKEGQFIRIFNSNDGEYKCVINEITNKKSPISLNIEE